MLENEISEIIIGKAIKIHKVLGPGLLESVYEEILCYELNNCNLICDKQVELPVFYEKIKINIGFRADLIIENKVIIELKSVENIVPVHKKQLLTYLKVSNMKLGLLINSNEKLIKHGITRIVYNL